jgi:endonuclease/exonuclease/phosphatase family metal-dependent hydrolase
VRCLSEYRLTMTKTHTEQYRVVSWNLNHGSNRDEQWRYLLDELDPDLALLQEVRQPPAWVAERGGAFVMAEKVPGSDRGTAIYVRKPTLTQILLQNRGGYFAAARLRLPGGRTGTALSVHAPTDTKLIGSSLTRYLRPVFDSLAAELSYFRGRCFVGGDFNLSRGFDASYRLSGHRSHEGFFAWLDSEHGLVECCCAEGEKRSLYRRGRAHADYQLDHLFVSRGLAESRRYCTVRDWSVGGLSDHAPVVGVFSVASV